MSVEIVNVLRLAGYAILVEGVKLETRFCTASFYLCSRLEEVGLRTCSRGAHAHIRTRAVAPRNMVPLCERARLGALVDSAVQASVTLGAVVRPSFGPNGTL